MNKKANIPISILVLGVLVLCGVVLFSFSFFDAAKNTVPAHSIVAITELNSVLEKYNFYLNSLGFSKEDSMKYAVDSTVSQDVFIETRNGFVYFVAKDENFEIYMPVSS